MALEKNRIEFAFQSPYLETDGRLAEKKFLGGIGHFAVLGDGAESPQLFQLVTLIIEAWGFIVQFQSHE
jgi:hypothetical protein